MQTITLNQLKQNTDMVFSSNSHEPILLTNEQNNLFLLMPLDLEKWHEALLSIYKSFNEIEHANNKVEISQHSMTGSNFVEKWSGVLKNENIGENWKDDYYDFLNEKYK